jgi:CRISPR-associated exonuclease Cas4
MPITATLVNYYLLCKRKMWLHAHNIRMEHTSDTVYEGKLIHQTVYPQRAERYREIEIDGCKIDFYDAKDKVVHEIKKSDKAEDAHVAQVKYYLYVLERNGISGVKGILEYPKLRKRDHIQLTEQDRQEIETWIANIEQILNQDTCPPLLNKPICKSCSYYDFCYSRED